MFAAAKWSDFSLLQYQQNIFKYLSSSRVDEHVIADATTSGESDNEPTSAAESAADDRSPPQQLASDEQSPLSESKNLESAPVAMETSDGALTQPDLCDAVSRMAVKQKVRGDGEADPDKHTSAETENSVEEVESSKGAALRSPPRTLEVSCEVRAVVDFLLSAVGESATAK